jgi:hypothetical protein
VRMNCSSSGSSLKKGRREHQFTVVGTVSTSDAGDALAAGLNFAASRHVSSVHAEL